MNSVIFLNLQQKKILDEAGIGIRTLTIEKLYEILSAADYRSVVAMTDYLQEKGKLLYECGFKKVVDVIDNTYLKPLHAVVDRNTLLNAVCPNKNTIIMWEEYNESYNTDNMFRQSMLNILNAMSAVLLFEDLKQTKQFEICYLNYL